MVTILACAAVLAWTAAAADLPRKAPELTIPLNSGKKVQVNAAYAGKAVCVAFILTTCSHCQNTTGILSRAQTEFGARGFQAIEASIEETGQALVPGFIQRFNPPFPVGFVPYATAQEYMQHSPMLIMHMPGLVFIDRQGRIVAVYEGDAPFMNEDVQEKNIRGLIEKLVGAGRK